MYFTCNFISEFLANFGYITRSGSVPWTLKMLPNIITNNQHHIPIFWYFPHIMAYLSYMEVPLTLKTFPNIGTNSKYHPAIFLDLSAILLLFFIQKTAHYNIWKCALDPENIPQCHHQEWALSPNFSQILVIITSSKPPTAPLST